MDTRSSNKHKHKASTQFHKKSSSRQSAQDKQAVGTAYIKKKFHQINAMISSSAKELYHSLSNSFSFEHIDFHHFNKYIWPMISSGAAFIVGEYVTTYMSKSYTESEEYDFVFKFLLGSAILGYCAAHRITEKRLTSTAEISAAVASEVLAITYLYTSTFRGSRMLLQEILSDTHSFVASLGVSALAIPSAASYLTQKLQEKLIKKSYAQGAQCSDTALISSGLTPISNYYFQANRFLADEMITGSRLFQLGLISENILKAQKILQRFRNLPALLADAGPSIVKKIVAQKEKIETDYQYNTAIQKVLRFTKDGPQFFDVPRYQLRTGDLVFCDKNFDLSSAPVSGEIIALQRNGEGQFTKTIVQKEYSINLKKHNGEDTWIKHKSNSTLSNHFTYIDLHALHDGKQAGVLVGDQLNLDGGDNFFIQIKPEKERNLINNYEKTSVINQIITERKQKSVLYSMLASIIMAGFLQRDITKLPGEALRLLFNLFQMMIPFSETFLREMVNSRLMSGINERMGDMPIETIDALRLVDFCNALGGYYHDKFPKGVAIISDKTGTLTTSKMDVLGLWTSDMQSDAPIKLKDDEPPLLPDKETLSTCFEIFTSAFTNNNKAAEPEEFAILQLFKSLQDNDDCLAITTEGNNHFRKKLTSLDKTKEIETFHLGLYRSFGGRLTIADEGQKKYLVFCGVPKRDQFQDTPLLKAYTSMQMRSGVLSRDWCIARAPISNEEFTTLKNCFYDDRKKDIELILINAGILKRLSHYCTFIINNPVKKGAEKFISQYRDLQVPVFVATGDTAKAAENIAHVLCPANTKKIFTIRPSESDTIDINKLLNEESLHDTTIIFAGINDTILEKFKQLLDIDSKRRPVVIFSEMSTEGKGILTQYLKNNAFFVVANGDGTNDVMMMKNANVVISHLTEEMTHAPGVAQLSNLSDAQLQKLLGSNNSFYELFDIHQPKKSKVLDILSPVIKSQEKPTYALCLKSSKMGFELANAVGVPDVKEMPQQHWFSVAFDLTWLWIAFQTIHATTDRSADNQHLNKSHFINQCLLLSLAAACFQALTTYATTGESTNLTCMVFMLSFLPFILRSIFSSVGEVRNELQPVAEPPAEDNRNASIGKSVVNFIGSFFHRKAERPREIAAIESPKPL